MSRAARKDYESKSAIAQGYGQQAAGEAGHISGLASSVPNDLTPEQKTAATRAALEPISATYAGVRDRGNMFASRTGAIAGNPELALESAREESRAKSDAGIKLTDYLMRAPLERIAMKGDLYGRAGQLYGGNYGTATSGAGQVAQQAYAPGFWSRLAEAGVRGFAQGVGGGL